MTSIPLKGSERAAVPGAWSMGPADPTERLNVTLLLRRRARLEFAARAAAIASGRAPGPILSRDEFAKRHGAEVSDMAAVRAFAAARGLAVEQEDAARRTVLLSGTVAAFSAAFGVQLHRMSHAGHSYRGRTGAISLPADLSGIVEAVFGLDNRAQAAPHFRRRRATPKAVSYTPLQVASAYGFPAGTGQGQCVALIELGGGFTPADLDTYFTGLGLATPSVAAVSVDGGTNSPTGDADGPDGEVMLDIEVVGAIAPQASIVVYFAPNTDAGFLDAITTAVHDTTNKPSVISISWGGAESTWTAQAMTSMDEAFQAAATLGITVCVASGDNGSSDGVSSGDHVDFPSSSPFALGCGGTSLQASGSSIRSEVVWNDGGDNGASGGGISSFFALPTWQSGLSAVDQGKSVALSMRGVPDVAGNADPETGYNVRIDGTDTVIGGTSAVAPLWAGLLARINQVSGKPAGYVNAQLYQSPKTLRDITSGNNGDFAAAVGWDACTGLGSPNGAALGGII
ncbi:MAG: S53 family peptidase [Steroidobacteraceae bacterium]